MNDLKPTLSTTRNVVVGDRFGYLVVRNYLGTIHKQGQQFECLCDCNNVKLVSRGKLLYGYVKSCGCMTKNLQSTSHMTHGETDTWEYKLWSQIKQRTLNPANSNYKHYGLIGIKMHEPWINDFPAFKKYIQTLGTKKPGYTLDRKNNLLGYEPGNLKWSSKKEQIDNRRRIETVERNLPLVAAKYGIPLDQLRNDIYG